MEAEQETATIKIDPRRNPFTLMEKEYLVDLVEEHKDLLDPVLRYNDSMTIYKRKQCWIDIGQKYNDKFPENKRDIDQLKRLWSKIKIQVKKYMNIPRTENNIWSLARSMFRLYTKNGRDEVSGFETLKEAIKKDVASGQQKEAETGSQQESSTSQTNASSDDDLIILDVVADNGSGVAASQSGYGEVVTTAASFLPISCNNQSKSNVGSDNQLQTNSQTVQIDGTQNKFVIENVVGSNPSENQPIPITNQISSFSYGMESPITKSTEIAGDYTLWHNIHDLGDSMPSLVTSSPVDIGRDKSSKRHCLRSEADHYFSRSKMVKRKHDYRNRVFKRANRSGMNKRFHHQGGVSYYEGENINGEISREEDFLSESSYRKRMLELAEEEHSQKMKLLKLKCEVVELQKQELVSKLKIDTNS